MYVKKRFLSEDDWQVSHALEITNSLDTKSFLMAVDIEEVFDHIKQSFLFFV